MAGAVTAGPPVARHAARVPPAAVAAIGAAWVLALGAQLSGAASLVHHDALLGNGPPSVPAAAGFLVAWQVMIVAMMLPSSLPLVRLFAAAGAAAPGARAAMAAFLSAYALVWTAFGTLAGGLDVAVHAAVDASPWLHAREWLLGGAVLALAGAFQFTPLKDACLRQCRHPASFLVRYYRRGVRGGFALGARHGVFCVGCCWAIMLVTFSVGVASLPVMAVLTAVMVHERTQPGGKRAVPMSGVALLTGAALVTTAHAAGVLS